MAALQSLITLIAVRVEPIDLSTLLKPSMPLRSWLWSFDMNRAPNWLRTYCMNVYAAP